MQDSRLSQNALFDINGNDDVKSIIGGNPTGIFNLNNIQYPWTTKLKSTMLGNFWLPEKVSMRDDVNEPNLPEAEDEAMKNTLSFLIFLDSIQISNIPNISEYITASEINALLTIQQFQELIHTDSYQYIQEALYDSLTRDEIYYRWRDNPLLLKRNKLIAQFYDDFKKNPTPQTLKQAIVANFVLEGVYFYSGFSFFHNLAFRQKRKNTDAIIRYIKNDELTHVSLFSNMINSREILNVDLEADRKLVLDIIIPAAEQEIEWATEIYGSNIEGMTTKSSSNHIKSITNDRLALLGMDKIYKDVHESPYAYLDKSTKANFFETTVTEYSRSETVSGWDTF